jgi:hypothetical protein
LGRTEERQTTHQRRQHHEPFHRLIPLKGVLSFDPDTCFVLIEQPSDEVKRIKRANGKIGLGFESHWLKSTGIEAFCDIVSLGIDQQRVKAFRSQIGPIVVILLATWLGKA